MMTLVDLMEVYRIKTGKSDNVDLLLDIYEEADLDERIDRDLLADLTLMECGGQFPRWNTTTVFFRFASSYLKSKAREYSGILDLYDAQEDYAPFDSFVEHEELHTDDTANDINARDISTSETRTPNLTERRTPDLTETRTPNLSETRTPNLTETRTPNLTTTENGDNYTTTHSVSADNETGFTPRTQDTNNQTTPKTSAQTGTETLAQTGSETKAETGTDTTTQTGTETVTNTGTEQHTSRIDNDYTGTSDRDIDTAKDKHGRNIPAQDLFFKELETLGVDIYQKIVNDFADNLMLGVC